MARSFKVKRAMSTFKVRPATIEDVDALVALVNSAYRGDSGRKGWTTEADLIGGQRTDRASLLEEMSKPGAVILVAERASGETGLLACVYLEKDGEQCYLGMLTVQVDLQREGLGRRLIAEAEKYAREAIGSKAMHLSVIHTRTELIEWYRRRGYALTGETKPFPYGQERFGVPYVEGLYFVFMKKPLVG